MSRSAPRRVHVLRTISESHSGHDKDLDPEIDGGMNHLSCSVPNGYGLYGYSPGRSPTLTGRSPTRVHGGHTLTPGDVYGSQGLSATDSSEEDLSTFAMPLLETNHEGNSTGDSVDGFRNRSGSGGFRNYFRRQR
ncbi:unnamed protein product, partial [Owenia fusiformis]